MDSIKATEIQISTVEDIKGPWFEAQLIQDVDVVDLARRDDDEGSDASS